MSIEYKIAKTVLGENVRPLDRWPGITAFLITAAILAGSYSPQNSTGAVVNWLDQALSIIVENGSLSAASVILVILCLMGPLERWIRSVKKIILSPKILVFPLAILVAALFALNHDGLGYSFWIFGFGFFCFLYLIRFEPTKTDLAPVSDGLHRNYFVERIAEILMEERDAPKRMAILGPWGTGKSTVLALLRVTLARRDPLPFAIALVNPWKAQTPEEAWAILAQGFDDALGRHTLFPKKWEHHPILVWLIDFIPGLKLTPAVVRYFAGYSSGRGEDYEVEKINDAIGYQLGANGQKILILVDDMERAEPAVVRSLLPIIDGLDRLKNCHFVFAIDPDRIARAFSEDISNEPLTKGYLDKVFDLKVPLPSARIEDLGVLLESEINDGKSPLLASAFQILRPLLPVNPRLALRFLNAARARERMFLHRLVADEITAVPFFGCWLIENEFSGFLEEVTQPEMLTLFDQLVMNNFMGSEGGSAREEVQLEKLIEKLSKVLKLAEGTAQDRLRLLVRFVARRAGGSIGWISGLSTSSSLNWIFRGHTQLESLTLQELSRLQQRWVDVAGQIPISQLINEVFDGADFCDVLICAGQLIRAECDRAADICSRGLVDSDRPGAFLGAKEIVNRLQTHFEFSRKEEHHADLSAFGSNFFYSWLQFLKTTVSMLGVHPLSAEIHYVGVKLHISVASGLSAQDSRAALEWRMRQELASFVRSDSDENLAIHVDRLREVLMGNISHKIVQMLKDGVFLRDSESDNPFGSLDFFIHPEKWLWMADERWKMLLRDLETDASVNKSIAETCVLIVARLFIHPAACDQCGGGHLDDRGKLLDLAGRHPEYLHFLWRTALQFDVENPQYRSLMIERHRASSKAFLEEQFLDEYFPVPNA